jgi:amino acid transporter
VLLIYGFLFMALIAVCIAVSLGELASAYPNSGRSRTSNRSHAIGGQYYWASRLAPKKYARFLSYCTGYLGWAGAVVVSGSVAVGLAQALVGMIILANPNVMLSTKTCSDGRLHCSPGRYLLRIKSLTSLPSGSTLSKRFSRHSTASLVFLALELSNE